MTHPTDDRVAMLTEEFIPFDQAMSGPPPLFMAFFGLVAMMVVAGFAFVIIKGVSQWRANEASPLRSVEALVVSRRADVRRHSLDREHDVLRDVRGAVRRAP